MEKIMAFVPTVDDAKAKTFYGDILGLAFVADDGFALLFQSGDTLLRIQRVAEFTPQPFTTLGWQVPDIADEVSRLTAAGVKFEIYEGFGQDTFGVMTFPGGGKVAWFKDPDGNLLSITQLT